jgi:hypothetical protein
LPAKLVTTVEKIKRLSNSNNSRLIFEFHDFMKENGASERHQNNNLKSIMSFAEFMNSISLARIDNKDDILTFLQSKIKDKDVDPDQKWITTYNDYLHRLKHFVRWLYNRGNNTSMDEWKTPDFIQTLKSKKTKRLSPYSETEIWDKDEFLSIIKYEPYKRNKAALALMWDLNARNHEITLLRIKNIRLKQKYGEGEIPFQAKTGSGPLLLTVSFPYVRDWLNEHPFRNESNARLICNLHTGAAIKPEALRTMMEQLKKRIIRLLETNEIADMDERNKITLLINSKRFNPYCIRHSSICHDSDYLPEYALKKKVRWRINSKQGARYIKNRMGNELKNKILEYNGIILEETQKKKPVQSICPRCDLSNVLENKYCSKCSYPLNPEAFEEIKQTEEVRFTELEKKYNEKISDLAQSMEQKFQQLLSKIDIQKIS